MPLSDESERLLAVARDRTFVKDHTRGMTVVGWNLFTDDAVRLDEALAAIEAAARADADHDRTTARMVIAEFETRVAELESALTGLLAVHDAVPFWSTDPNGARLLTEAFFAARAALAAPDASAP